MAKLKADIELALRAEPGEARALEALASTWLPDGVVAQDAQLKSLLKLTRGRALLLLKRWDEALGALTEARQAAETLPKAEQRRLVGEVRYRVGEIEEGREAEPDRCGQRLGLRRLAALEGVEARERVERAAQRYQSAVQVGDRFWARRAAYRIALLYEGYYRRGVEAHPSFRGAALPSPFSISKVDGAALLSEVLHGRWPSEIGRLYAEVIASIDARDPDPVLLQLARDRAAALAKIEKPPEEIIESPWRTQEREGLVRYARRFEKRTGDLWLAFDANEAKARLIEQLGKGPGTVDHAYALAAFAEAGPPPGTEEIDKALGHSEARVRIAGLFAAERQPDAALWEKVIARYLATPEAERRAPFSTASKALWGEAARSLRALRAIADKERTLAEKLVADTRLPARERAWIVAELGDARLGPPLHTMTYDREPEAAATALYAAYVTQGKNALGLLRTGAEGPLGCVSRGIQRLDAGR